MFKVTDLIERFFTFRKDILHTYIFDLILMACIKEYDLRAQTDFETEASEPNI